MELATGTGKSKLSIDLANYLINSQWYKDSKQINILILVAKRVHKQTWEDELKKWGGIHHPTAKIHIHKECYESLKNHCRERWDIILADEVHHVASDIRLDILQTLSFGYFIGLSATIPQKLKQFFRWKYHAEIVSCDIVEAISDDILPEPQILLFPLEVENTKVSETLELHTKAPVTVHCDYQDLYKYKFKNVHVICKCTQKQKLHEIDELISFYKRKWEQSYNEGTKKTWLYFCGKRLEFLADCKLQWVKLILHHLNKERTITFCKTIAQTEQLGKNCIHSQNKNATTIYNDFNEGKIDHITAVNILNENANLVNCKYGIFLNINASDIVVVQRIGRSLRHKHPVIVFPYYKGTREEELIEKHLEGYNKDFIKVIHSVKEI